MIRIITSANHCQVVGVIDVVDVVNRSDVSFIFTRKLFDIRSAKWVSTSNHLGAPFQFAFDSLIQICQYRAQIDDQHLQFPLGA